MKGDSTVGSLHVQVAAAPKDPYPSVGCERASQQLLEGFLWLIAAHDLVQGLWTYRWHHLLAVRHQLAKLNHAQDGAEKVYHPEQD